MAREITTKEQALSAMQCRRWLIKYLPENLKTPEVCLAALMHDDSRYARFIPSGVFENRDFCYAAVQKDSWAIEFVPDSLKTAELCLLAIQKNGKTLEFVPESLKTPELCLVAVQNHGYALKYVPEEHITSELCLAAVQQDGMALEYVPDTLKTTELYISAVQKHGYTLKDLPKSFQTPELCLAVVQQDGRSLEYVPEVLKTYQLCHVAVQNHGNALEYVPDEFKTSELCLAALQYKNIVGLQFILKYVPEKLKTGEFCLFAVQRHGLSLEFVPEKIKTPEICLTAVQQHGFALEFVPEEFKTEELCLAAVQKHGYSLKFVPEKVKTQEVCLAAVQQNNYALFFVPDKYKTENDFQKTMELCIDYVQYPDGRALRYIPEKFKTKELCLIAASNLEDRYYDNPDLLEEFIALVPKNLRSNVKKTMLDTEFLLMLEYERIHANKFFVQFDYPLNKEGQGVSAEFFSENEETAKKEAMDVYKEQFGDQATGKIIKFIRYRWASEVKQLCIEKYGTAFPCKIECGYIEWRNVPFFAMPYSPMRMKMIPYLEMPDASKEKDTIRKKIKEHDETASKQGSKPLTPEQLELLGINFDPYDHSNYQGGKAYIELKGKRMEIAPKFGKIS
ncbi:MAG: DUF4116 domain-containing protein [Treponema sp.]|nr:DUF4116 domain-containing protein [Treponema sp.]